MEQGSADDIELLALNILVTDLWDSAVKKVRKIRTINLACL